MIHAIPFTVATRTRPKLAHQRILCVAKKGMPYIFYNGYTDCVQCTCNVITLNF